MSGLSSRAFNMLLPSAPSCFVFQLAALGPRGYAGDRFNLFDGLIVISSLVELMVYPPSILTGDGADDSLGGLSALRTFRVFRVFKLARLDRRCRHLSGHLSLAKRTIYHAICT